MTCKPYSHFKMGCYTCECNGDGIAECDATDCGTVPKKSESSIEPKESESDTEPNGTDPGKIIIIEVNLDNRTRI